MGTNRNSLRNKNVENKTILAQSIISSTLGQCAG